MSTPYDDILDGIGPEVELAELDPLWERVARGTATQAELQTLEARASAEPDVALRLQMLQPLDPDRLQRRAEQLETTRPTPSPWWSYLWLPGMALALAAILGVRPGPPEVLRDLQMTVVAGTHTTRGAAPDGPRVLSNGSQVELVLRGALPRDTEVSLWLDGTRPRPLFADVQVQDHALQVVFTLPTQGEPGTPGRVLVVPHGSGPAPSSQGAPYTVDFTWGAP